MLPTTDTSHPKYNLKKKQFSLLRTFLQPCSTNHKRNPTPLIKNSGVSSYTPTFFKILKLPFTVFGVFKIGVP